MVRFLALSTFTVSPFTFLVSHSLFCSLACRLVGIAPLITSIADLGTVLYVDGTLCATVRCTDDEILNLQSTFNAFAQLARTMLHCKWVAVKSNWIICSSVWLSKRPREVCEDLFWRGGIFSVSQWYTDLHIQTVTLNIQSFWSFPNYIWQRYTVDLTITEDTYIHTKLTITTL